VELRYRRHRRELALRDGSDNRLGQNEARVTERARLASFRSYFFNILPEAPHTHLAPTHRSPSRQRRIPFRLKKRAAAHYFPVHREKTVSKLDTKS
jgi:hypothetical protein